MVWHHHLDLCADEDASRGIREGKEEDRLMDRRRVMMFSADRKSRHLMFSCELRIRKYQLGSDADGKLYLRLSFVVSYNILMVTVDAVRLSDSASCCSDRIFFTH